MMCEYLWVILYLVISRCHFLQPVDGVQRSILECLAITHSIGLHELYGSCVRWDTSALLQMMLLLLMAFKMTHPFFLIVQLSEFTATIYCHMRILYSANDLLNNKWWNEAINNTCSKMLYRYWGYAFAMDAISLTPICQTL